MILCNKESYLLVIAWKILSPIALSVSFQNDDLPEVEESPCPFFCSRVISYSPHQPFSNRFIAAIFYHAHPDECTDKIPSIRVGTYCIYFQRNSHQHRNIYITIQIDRFGSFCYLLSWIQYFFLSRCESRTQNILDGISTALWDAFFWGATSEFSDVFWVNQSSG